MLSGCGSLVAGGLVVAACAPPLAAAPAPSTFAAVPPDGAARLGLGVANVLRGSRFDTTLSATPGRVGGGFDGASEILDLAFSLTPRWSFVDTADDWAWAGARVGWRAVVSDTAAHNLSGAFEDVELHLAYSRTFLRAARGIVLLGGPRLGLAFPASAASRSSKVYLRSSLGLGADLHLPLLGGAWLPSAFFSVSGTWEHAITGVASPCQNQETATGPAACPSSAAFRPAVGAALLDQGRLFAPGGVELGGSFTVALGAWVTVYRDLALGNTWGVIAPDSQGPAPARTIFDVALGYAIANVVWVAFGYNNTNAALSGAGQEGHVLYSRAARGYVQLGLLFDGVLAKARPG